MTIEARVPSALAPGDDVLVWWPDWFLRRAVLLAAEHEGDGWRLVVRFRDGDDAFLETIIFRGEMEPVPVVVKSSRHGTLENPNSVTARSTRKGRARRRDADPTAEDEALAAEYLNGQ